MTYDMMHGVPRNSQTPDDINDFAEILFGVLRILHFSTWNVLDFASRFSNCRPIRRRSFMHI